MVRRTNHAERRSTKGKIMKVLNQKETGWNDDGLLTLAWADHTRDSFDISELSEKMRFHLALHGLKQKLRDDASDAKNHADPIAYSKDCANAIWDMLKNDAWKRVKVSTASADLCAALVRFMAETPTPKTEPEVWDMLAPMDTKARNDLSNQPAIAQHLADIAKEKASTKAETIDIAGLFS